MYRSVIVCVLAGVSVLATRAAAQDSVSKTNCLPGDAVSPYAAGTAPLGTEQVDHFVVDMTPFTTSWGTQFGVAPIIKSSKTGGGFFGSLISSHGISRDQLVNVPFPSDSYSRWTAAGFGVNNDPAISNPGTPVDVSSFLGNQFSAAMTEFSTTDQGASYNSIVGALVNIIPNAPGRLYVTRVMAALNGCNGSTNLSQPALGSMDAHGNMVFRADGFNTTGGCGMTLLPANNVFHVNIAARNPAIQNVISNTFPGLFDTGASHWPVMNQTDNWNPPAIMPASVTGGVPLLLAGNFLFQYCRGPVTGAAVCDQTHVTGQNLIDQRGNLSYTQRNCTFLASTHGIAAILGRHTGICNMGQCTDTMHVFGLGSTGNVTGRLQLKLPPTVTDNDTGFVSLVQAISPNEFNNYRSQVAFRGGNGQIALGTDSAGRLLAAAQVDHPFTGWVFDPPHELDWDVNYIAVARVNCTNGQIQWTMAGYNSTTGGKPILNGPAGISIGKMVPITGDGSGGGPAVSSPMIDSAGNVWFVSAIELNANPGVITRALLRAVYNPTNFSYRLELVAKFDDVFAGQNSGRNYRITFIDLRDSNSISSGAVFSHNISQAQHLGGSLTGLANSDPRTLGGMVIGVEITYDNDQDGDYQQCTGATGTGADQEYNVLLYIGALTPGQGCTTDAQCGDADVCTTGRCMNNICVVSDRPYGDVTNDAEVDVFDIMCAVDGSQNEFSSDCTAANADISPCSGNALVNIGDINAVLDGFEGVDLCCGDPVGACCTLGQCEDNQTQADCIADGGAYQGDASACSGVTCPPAGACCTPGACELATQSDCAGADGAYLGNGTNCTTGVCPAFGACCVLGICDDAVGQTVCASQSGVFQGSGSVCANVMCPRGACCLFGVCQEQQSASACTMAGGTYQGDDVDCADVKCPAASAIQINEIRVDQTGDDLDEYFELIGPPGATLNNLTYFVIGDGAAGSGVIDTVASLAGQTIPASGLFVVAEPTFTLGMENLNASLNFENSDNVTHLLVSGFTGVNGQDLDTNDDGVLDAMPWSMLVDKIALVEEPNPPTMTEYHYGPPSIGPDGIFVPGHIYRCPDGSGAWQIGLFDAAGGEDTPGAANQCTPSPVQTTTNEVDVAERLHPDPADDSAIRHGKAIAQTRNSQNRVAASTAVPTIVLEPVGGGGGFIEISPGQQVVIEAYVTGAGPDAIRGYQVVVSSEVPSSGTGAPMHVVGSPTVNTARPDFVFNGIAMNFTATVADGTARAASAVFNENALVPQGTRYLAQFVFQAPPDASGDYFIDVLNPGAAGGSNLANAAADPLAVNVSGAIVVVSCNNPIPGDYDCDGDVDLNDYTAFQSCFSGLDVPHAAGCDTFDANNDNDVDLIDFGAFMDRFTE